MKKKTLLIHGIPHKDFYDELLERKDLKKIYVTEFRPNLFGAQQVCKELLKRKLKPILICDNMVGFCLEKRMIDEINLFAKSKTANGVICFVGSLIYAICARWNRAKVFVYPAGRVKKIPKNIHVLSFLGKRIAPSGVQGLVLLWEEVPNELIYKIKD